VNSKNSLLKIVLLDVDAIGRDLDFSALENLGTCNFHSYTSADEIIERASNADIIITNKVKIQKTHLTNLPNLKLICIAATGMNNIDLKACEDLSIEVKNVKGYSTSSVVQHTFCFALNLLTSAPQYYNYTASGAWLKSKVFTNLDYTNRDLEDKVWGVIGLGSIGKKVAMIADAFGAKVQYFSTSGLNNNSDFEQVELNTLLKTSDIISIHAPLNEKTKNLIGAHELSQLKEKSILINMGRGEIIDSQALADKIKKEDSYFGIDVLENEPYLENDPIFLVKEYKNLLLTPHTAWASKEARSRLLIGIIENIKLCFNL